MNSEKSWNISERTLPAPAAASDELQTEISNTPNPNVEDTIKSTPTNETEWVALIKERNGEIEPLVKEHSPALGISIEEDDLDGVIVRRVMHAEIAPEFKNNIFVHLHGGAYILNGGLAGAAEAVLIAARLRIPVISIDYRMPPAHPFPAALNDVVSAYKNLLQSYTAESIVLGGTSAGGGLTFASIHKFKELNLKLPAVLFAGTPWTDLTKSLDSLYVFEGIDRALVTYDGILEKCAEMYAGEYELTNPFISPLNGDFKDFPPTQLVTGTRDLFLSHTALAHRKLRLAGVEAELNVYEGIAHADYLQAWMSPESAQIHSELRDFILKYLQ